MSRYLAVIVMGAVEEEGTFWIQLLMMVMLAAGAGIYLLIKSRAKRVERQTHDEAIETIIEQPVVSLVEPPKPLSTGHTLPQRPAALEIKPPRRNLSAGMELLARNFLVSVVERIDSADQRDIAMRCLCFNELSRRGQLASIASIALKIYTLDEDGFYGKVIRREAMAELAGRTRPDESASENSETTIETGRSRMARESTNVSEIHPSSPANSQQAASASHQAG